MRRTTMVAALAAVSLALAACGNGDGAGDGDTNGDNGTDDDGSDVSVEVFTWWAAGSEELGLNALVEVFNEQHPDVAFINGAIAGGAGSAAKDLLQSRLQANDPPDTFQGHAGEELIDYITAGQIEDVSHLYEEFDLYDAFPEGLVDLITHEGAIYSVPANIHRSNVVWANPSVLEDAGLDPGSPPASMSEWFDALDAVEAAGYTALSLATTWTQVHLLETVLMADLGADGYNGLWDGSTSWDGEEVATALESFERLVGYTNTDRDGIDWPEATQLVIDGTAAYNVMGDWAVAAFEEQGVEDYVHFPVPGTGDQFGFLADSFTLPVGAPSPEGARAWLETVGSLEGQIAFNQIKGSIPARVDADPSLFSDYQQTAIESFNQDIITPSIAHGTATSIAHLNAISDATSRFTTGAIDVAAFQTELAAAAG